MREHLTFLFWFAAVAGVVYIAYTKFLNAPAHTDPSIPIPYSNKEGKSMLVDISPAPTASIPPIDAAAPARVETATFALG